VNGELIINPTKKQLEESDIDMMIGASKDSVCMVEGEMKEISEAEMVEAIKFAHEAIIVQTEAQEKMRAALSLDYRTYEPEENDDTLKAEIHTFAYDKFYAIAAEASAKHERTEKFEIGRASCRERVEMAGC